MYSAQAVQYNAAEKDQPGDGAGDGDSDGRVTYTYVCHTSGPLFASKRTAGTEYLDSVIGCQPQY